MKKTLYTAWNEVFYKARVKSPTIQVFEKNLGISTYPMLMHITFYQESIQICKTLCSECLRKNHAK